MKRGALRLVKSVVEGARSRIFIAAVVLTSILGGCTNSDIFFGNDMIPDAQNMFTQVDSTMTVKTSLISMDGVTTSNFGFISIGKYVSENYGMTRTQGVSSFHHSAWDDETTMFGTNPTLDSMILNLYFYSPIGDYTSDSVVVNLYTLKGDPLDYYKTYKSDVDIEAEYRGDTFLGQVTATGYYSLLSLHLPESYYSQFYFDGYDDEDGVYVNDSLFIEKYKGIYFELDNPEPEAGKEGLMYWLDFTYSGLTLYYHNEDEDTTYTNYIFYDSYDDSSDYTEYIYYVYYYGYTGTYDEYKYYGNRFYTIEHDYSYADAAQGGVDTTQIGDTTLNLGRIFLQGMGGLGARVELDTTYINDLKQQALDAGYTNVALHRASIKWHVEEKTTDTYNQIAERLGMYYNYADSSFILDYNPIYEGYYSITQDIDGYMNRSHGYFEQVFTSTLQNLFNKPDDEPYTTNGDYSYVVQILPSWYEMAIYSEGVIGGGSSTDIAPEIALVYTFIK